jgi:hypothetical protein
MDNIQKQAQRQALLAFAEDIKKRKEENRRQNPNDFMAAHRPAHKAKDGVESMPTYYHTGDMGRFLDTYKTAQRYGAPAIPAEKLAAMALIEGREDFGYNGVYNYNNPRAVQLFEMLVSKGADKQSAGFAASILDKSETAKRLKIPFENAWNGTGTSIWDKTGRDYVGKVKEAEKVLEHPKNKPIYDFIKNKLSAEEEGAPTLASADSVQMPQEYTEGNWKLI